MIAEPPGLSVMLSGVTISWPSTIGAGVTEIRTVSAVPAAAAMISTLPAETLVTTPSGCTVAMDGALLTYVGAIAVTALPRRSAIPTMVASVCPATTVAECGEIVRVTGAPTATVTSAESRTPVDAKATSHDVPGAIATSWLPFRATTPLFRLVIVTLVGLEIWRPPRIVPFTASVAVSPGIRLDGAISDTAPSNSEFTVTRRVTEMLGTATSETVRLDWPSPTIINAPFAAIVMTLVSDDTILISLEVARRATPLTMTETAGRIESPASIPLESTASAMADARGSVTTCSVEQPARTASRTSRMFR